MRLYFHPESDSLFWDDFCSDPLADDVTDVKEFRAKAKERGLREPEVISEVIDLDHPVTKFKEEHTFASAVIASYRKWERKPADVYPTPVDGTESIMPMIRAMSAHFAEINGRPIQNIWEPCCGDGRLSRVLEHHGFNVVSTDIREYSGYGLGSLDFLNETPKGKWGWWDAPKPDLIVLNPPFSLSVEFIQRALGYTPWVICLVKQNYYNTINRYDFFGEMRPNFFLPMTFRLAFLEEERGKSPLMDCAWAVWGPCYEDHCIFEPIKRIKYPGYAKKGLVAVNRILEGEMLELTSVIATMRGEIEEDPLSRHE